MYIYIYTYKQKLNKMKERKKTVKIYMRHMRHKVIQKTA